MVKSAILFMVFNRPESTIQVFNAIRQAKPTRLYVAADGPRENKQAEQELCKEVRKIATSVDWECEVKVLFRKENLGCGKAVSQAITWFFKNEEEGIILEDDVLPHSDFFEYCDLLLERYRYNNEVKFISGRNALSGKAVNKDSYYFSAFSYVWGWAAWRRTWDIYDFELEGINFENFNKAIDSNFDDNSIKRYWRLIFKQMKYKLIDTWDFQLLFSLWLNHSLSIQPNINLTRNIGFGENATHTKEVDNIQANLGYQPILPLTHPQEIQIQKEADKFLELSVVNHKLSILQYQVLSLKTTIKSIIHKIKY